MTPLLAGDLLILRSKNNGVPIRCLRPQRTSQRKFSISREDQDAFALRSHQKAIAAQDAGRLADEITSVTITQRKRDPVVVEHDEGPRRESSLAALAKLPTPFKEGGTVTAGNASSVNDGACALLLASEHAIKQHGLTPKARVVAMATSGLAPRIMGFGPFEAATKALKIAGLSIDQMDVVELNEAFAAQGLAVTRALGLADDAAHINPIWGRDFTWAPIGDERCATCDNGDVRIKSEWRSLWSLHHVYWCWSGHCLDHRAYLNHE